MPDLARFRTPAFLAAALAALLPFERAGSFDLGGLTVRPSQLALLALLAALGLALRRREIPFEWRANDTLRLVLFLAACALSLLNAEAFGRSFVVLAFVAFTASQAIALPHALRTVTEFLRVRAAILWSAAAVCAFGLWQFFGDMLGFPAWLTGLRSHYTKEILGFTRVQSTALEPLYFADYLLIPLGLAGAWFLSETDAKRRRWLLGAIGLFLLLILLTASRGGYLGAAAVAVVLAWRHRGRLTALKRFIGAAALGTVIALAGVALIGRFAVTTREPLSDTFLRHVTTVTDGAAYVERMATGAQAVDAFLRHPLIGVGIGGYGPHLARFPHVQPETGWAIVNNEPLELLAETGVIGLAAFVAFIVGVLSGALRPLPPRLAELSPMREGLLAALAGILVHYQTFSTLYVMHVWFAIGLLIAIRRATERP